jgi:tetratricopeptide (TPR) repeat protein
LAAFLGAGLLAAAPALAQAPAGPQPPAAAQPEPQATHEPAIAPAPAWVEPVAAGTPDPALADRAAQWLLSNSQSLYGADHDDHYLHVAFLIQNAQGLQGLGNIVIPWNPEMSDLVIHKVQIIRGGQTIDLLAGGRRFTVLRRENNLESAVLDGTLTAVMQADGLAVGDILDVSWTTRRRGGTLPLRAEDIFMIGGPIPIRRLAIRQIWPASLPIHWRGTGAFEHARARTTARGTELSVELADASTPQPPAQMPARLLMPSTLELTQYRDWAEMSDMLASHYRDAARLAPEGPLRAEIARIAAATPDPGARAMAALRLVQEQVRYFALVMGDGNYLPAGAEQTWFRRYADCKGKAVLLVSLLQALGIEAEPVAVNTETGDGLGERLPMMPMFNHVIVRARIEGHSYWLDGTRTGDRSLDDLAFSSFGWGLPIRAGGAALEQLPFGPPARPLDESTIVYDGSHGLTGPVPVRTEFAMRGDAAVQMRQSLAQLGHDAFLRSMREQMTANPSEGFTIGNVDFRDDPESGTFTFILTGQRVIDWQPVPGTAPAGGPRRMMFDLEVPSFELGALRPDGPFHDAPVALPVPLHAATSETMILPDGGRGFSIDGRDVERVIAGTRFTRHLTLADGRVTARWEATRIAREISAADARASTAQLRELRDDKAYLRAPSGSVDHQRAATAPIVRPAEGAAAIAVNREPTTARDFVQRGYERLQTGALDEADSDFEHAGSLSPSWSRPIANRAIVLIHRGRFDEAETLLARAAGLDANDFVVHQGRGLIQMSRHRPIQAIVEFTRTLELDPGNAFTLVQRASAYQQVGEFDDALADLSEVLTHHPDNQTALAARARLHAWRGEGDQAVADANALVAVDPHDPARLARRAGILRDIGRTDAAAAAYTEALAAIDARAAAAPKEAEHYDAMREALFAASGQTARAIAMMDARIARHAGDPGLLNERCWARATANVELPRALADCDLALAHAPDNGAIFDSRAFVKLRMGQYDAAIADEDAALSHTPNLPAALYTRGIAHLRKGEREAGERDLAAARRLAFDIDATYRAYGVTP